SIPLVETSTYANSANRPSGEPNVNPFSNTAKSGPGPLRMPVGKVAVRYPGGAPFVISVASRSPRLLNPVAESDVAPRGAKYVRAASMASAHSTNAGLSAGIAGSIGCVVSVGPE